MLKYMSPYAITTMYNKIPFVLNNGTLRGQARKAISTFFKEKYGLPISKTFTLKIPARRGVTRKQIKKLVMIHIEGTKMPRYIKRYLQYRTNIVFTKTQSLKDILSNNIQYGKNWKKTGKKICKCKEIHKK